MEVPRVYLDSLPKNEKACLEDTLYQYITADQFSPDCLLDYLDLSSEYSTLEIASRRESAVQFWSIKHQVKKPNKAKIASFWGSSERGLASDMEKSKLFANRADTLLKNLKLQCPGLTQTTLDTHKIQYNKDVGKSVLESYSRFLESLAFSLMARIDDVLYVDAAAKKRAAAESISMLNIGGLAYNAHDNLENQNLRTSFSNLSVSSSSVRESPFHSSFSVPRRSVTRCRSTSRPTLVNSPDM